MFSKVPTHPVFFEALRFLGYPNLLPEENLKKHVKLETNICRTYLHREIQTTAQPLPLCSTLPEGKPTLIQKPCNHVSLALNQTSFNGISVAQSLFQDQSHFKCG